MNINEIARLAGVSRTTVSRYLNDGYVSEEKKERPKMKVTVGSIDGEAVEAFKKMLKEMGGEE